MVTLDKLFAFKLLNFICGVFLTVSGFIYIFAWTFKSVVIGAYAIFFGLLMAILEFRVPAKLSNNSAIGFLWSWTGRGFFYVFWGFLIIVPPFAGTVTFDFFSGLLLIFMGLFYTIVAFVFPQWKLPIAEATAAV
ncbi:Golgi apparatus membrane protein TVP15 [Paraphysoderma sedebokerense]|nr:Golgi apparatus membrane protein TVP15 [Paraphysoderma sedebokerense]